MSKQMLPQPPTPVQSVQHSRPPSSGVHPHSSQQSPRQPPSLQATHPAPFPSPHTQNQVLPQQHSSPYSHHSQGAAHPHDISYYPAQSSPYGSSSTSGNYSSSEMPELMTAAHMNRPYPPMYHTPQSNSPASVSSPAAHEQHGRNLYAPQASAQMSQSMFAYQSQYPSLPPSGPSYGPTSGGPPPPSLNPQPLLMTPQSITSSMSHPVSLAHHHAPPPAVASSPRTRMAQAPSQGPPPQVAPPPTPLTPRVPTGSVLAGAGMNANASAVSVTPLAGAHTGASTPAGATVNSNAAPGPIPATTPLVVRQDRNGVQWIAFEYSRDRVKMEYEIRCDVENVNVDELSTEFKTDNCVYPRACCPKEQYRGNRLAYETECNTVGWALAELNPPLRGKRGLIQRAVDSWRNSNRDPRLRSRRVRRMAKVNRPKAVPSTPRGSHMVSPVGVHNHSGPNGVGTIIPGGLKPGLGLPGPQLHHHHAPESSGGASSGDNLSSGGTYSEHPQHHHHQAPNGSVNSSITDARHRHLFHNYPNRFSNDAGVSVSSLPPSTYDAMAHIGAHPSSHATTIATSAAKGDRNAELFGDLPEKRRKFILVDDPERSSRVRVRVMLDNIEMNEIPDSFRKTNAVFPRSYFPFQMQSPRQRRFLEDEDDDGNDEQDGSSRSGRGRTLVRVPLLDGSEAEVATPRIDRARRRKEMALNDLGYRMSWTQSRVFAGRPIFLQVALDAYRNKMRSTMLAEGQDASQISPIFETRIGKRRWLERTRRSGRATTP